MKEDLSRGARFHHAAVDGRELRAVKLFADEKTAEKFCRKSRWGGAALQVVELQEGRQYYTRVSTPRHEAFVLRVHGVDDGHHGSTQDTTIPSALKSGK